MDQGGAHEAPFLAEFFLYLLASGRGSIISLGGATTTRTLKLQ